jgi:hypothetical protein
VEWSNEADLTIMGLNIPDEADLAAYAERMDETIARMGSVLLVRSGTGRSCWRRISCSHSHLELLPPYLDTNQESSF